MADELVGTRPGGMSLLGGVADLLEEGVAVVRRDDGAIVEANLALRSLLGLSTDHAPDLRDLVAAVDVARVDRLLAVRSRHGDHLALQLDDGSARHVEVTAQSLDGTRVLLELRDASAQALVQRQLADARRRLRMTFDGAPLGLALATLGGVLLEPNPALDRLLVGGGGTTAGRALADHLAQAHHAELLTALGHVATQATPYRLQAETRVGGRWLLLSLSRVEPEQHGASEVLVQAEDVTDRVLAERQVDHGRLHDELTGLANRVLLADRLELALSRRARRDREVALLVFDLDGFKAVNDRAGHLGGDLVLVEVAERLRSTLRPEDTIARVGGDEFVVLLEDLSQGTDEAELVAERVHRALSTPMRVDGHRFQLAASIGVAVASPSHTVERLLREADLAMFRAKHDATLGPTLFDDAMRVRTDRRNHAEAALRAALEGEGIEVHYQPIIDLRDGRLAGAEALVRLRDPGGDLVAPAAFLDVAEDTGLVVPMGEHVLRTACRRAATWRADHPRCDLRLSVNVSLRQLTPPFVGVVRDVLAETGLAAEALTLEVTESLLLSAAPSARIVLSQLAAMGIGLALDDFGTGASSLAYLRTFPVSTIKADRSFVSNAVNDPRDRAIVQTVVDLGERLRMDVVAEGVETSADLRLLLEVGARYAQGYLFGRPMPADEFAPLLRKRASLAFGTTTDGDRASNVIPITRARTAS